ncbi:PilN domain-containing protein [Fodinibius sediminis]|uniref:Fimbrial assembly protein (PilN) n=1 Tax=Fodinibius sediminis TaxID=1214077 RepID=A0A521EMU0_9BACT|nr:PilN domain-containing protein [Fodinibius sediminis]SMO85243.1 hypothetical protein SAMN06265218_11763 [Fodinibius sediminis]
MAKEYLGLTLEGDLLKIARIKKEKNGWKLTQLDRMAIKEEEEIKRGENRSKEVVKDYDEDFHFGLDERYEENGETTGELDLLMAVDKERGGENAFNANVMTVSDVLSEKKARKISVGMTIRNGDCNFQIFRDKDYSHLKKKELQQFVEEHLDKVYGSVPSADRYEYKIREDGSLLLISYQNQPYLLRLLEEARDLQSGKVNIGQVLPDEAILASLVKQNYELASDEITCVIHMSFNRTRIFFMRGNQIQYVISPIDEGRDSRKVLDVIFSKILFQLDTGELSSLDRILVTNNDLNGTSINYFKKQFPDVRVDEFRFKADALAIPEHLEAVTGFFTSAIGVALAAAENKNTDYSEYSLLPTYIEERQNTLKLRWHGIILLLLLLVTPTVWNWMYQQKQQQISDLNDELFRTELRIMDLEPVVAQAHETQQLYEVEQRKMGLLEELSQGSYYWSETLKTLNDGLNTIKNVWIERIKYAEQGFMLQGYSMTRDRIPQVTNLFESADLKAVSVVEMRDVRLYKFTIKVHNRFTDNLDQKFAEQSNTINNNKEEGGTNSDLRN